MNHEYTFNDINNCFIGPCAESAPHGTQASETCRSSMPAQMPAQMPNTILTISNLNCQYMLSYNRHHILPVVYHSEVLNEYGIDIHMHSFVLKLRFSNDSMYSNTMSLLGLAERLKNGL